MARRSPASPENSEFLTRRAIVDPKLAAAGWKVCDYNPSKPLSVYHACALVEYQVYSQRFQQGDFEEGEKFDPNVLPNS